MPQPAMIFTSETSSLSTDSLTVCYVNKMFKDSIGDTPLSDRESSIFHESENNTAVPPNFTSILQAQCINPSASHFTQWVNQVASEPDTTHVLKTRFKGFATPKDPSITEKTPQFIDIEWNAILMENKFIVLTGRRTGTVQFSTNAPSDPSSNESGSDVIEEEEEVTPPTRVPEIARSSSSSSGSNSTRFHRKRTSRGISSRTSVSDRSRMELVKEEGILGYQGDTWRHIEKVIPP
jgi:hypothetical protein